jgi:prevent-host-death family protein
MESVGVRELKTQASRILRRVRQRRETIAVTYRGKVVARLVPAEGEAAARETAAAVWADLDDLAAEIGARWPKRITAARAVREQRREL